MHSIIICEDDQEQLAYLSMLVQNYIQFHKNQFRLVYEGTDPQTTLNYIQQEAIKKGLYFVKQAYPLQSGLSYEIFVRQYRCLLLTFLKSHLTMDSFASN